MFTSAFPPLAFLLAQVQQITATVFGSSMASSSQRSRGGNQNIIVNNLAAVTTAAQNASPVNAR